MKKGPSRTSQKAICVCWIAPLQAENCRHCMIHFIAQLLPLLHAILTVSIVREFLWEMLDKLHVFIQAFAMHCKFETLFEWNTKCLFFIAIYHSFVRGLYSCLCQNPVFYGGGVTISSPLLCRRKGWELRDSGLKIWICTSTHARVVLFRCSHDEKWQSACARIYLNGQAFSLNLPASGPIFFAITFDANINWCFPRQQILRIRWLDFVP